MKYLLKIGLFFLTIGNINSQTTVWLEDFTSELNNSFIGNNDNTINSAFDFTTFCSTCNYANEFRVLDNEYEIKNTDEIATWTSEVISISSYTSIGVSVNLMETGNLEDVDQITVYYKLNGGAKTIFPTNGFFQNDFSPKIATVSGLLGTTMQIIIEGITTHPNKRIYFDNIEITGTLIYVVATSPNCGVIHISDTIKTVALETALLWLKSNKGTSTLTDGVAISDWNDNSTNANHVTQPTSGNRPTFRDNITDNFNFNPSIEFVNDHLLKTAPGIFVSGATYTHVNTYMVFKDKDVSNFDWMVYEGNSGIDRFSFSANYSGGIHSAYDLTTTTRMVSPSPSAGIINLYSFNTGTSAVYGTASNQRRVYSLNGTQTLTNNTFPGFTGTNNTFFIGNITGVADAPAPFDGYFGEILIIEDEVSLIKHQQIETYLAIKYGITLGHDYLNSDTNVIYDISNGYANGIFGIGRSSAFDLYQPKSRSETAYSGVTIEATVSIGEENYLIIGHDGGSLTKITLAGQTNVLTRKWFAKMHKGIGTISMELDLATIGASTGLSASNVKIGVSNSASFTRTKWIEATTVVGGVAYFTGIPLYDKYFTFSAAP